jgi:hypothetical protein
MWLHQAMADSLTMPARVRCAAARPGDQGIDADEIPAA